MEAKGTKCFRKGVVGNRTICILGRWLCKQDGLGRGGSECRTLQVCGSQCWLHVGATPARCTPINEIRISGGGSSYSPGDSVMLPELRTAAVAQVRKDEGLRAVGVQVRSRHVLGRKVGQVGLCG